MAEEPLKLRITVEGEEAERWRDDYLRSLNGGGGGGGRTPGGGGGPGVPGGPAPGGGGPGANAGLNATSMAQMQSAFLAIVASMTAFQNQIRDSISLLKELGNAITTGIQQLPGGKELSEAGAVTTAMQRARQQTIQMAEESYGAMSPEMRNRTFRFFSEMEGRKARARLDAENALSPWNPDVWTAGFDAAHRRVMHR